jgi:predicted lipoprotein
MKKLFLMLAVVLTFSNCNDDGGGSTDDFDRTELLMNLADGFVFPALNDFQTRVSELENAVTNFNSVPNSTTLDALKTSFEAAYLSWQYVNIFEFGLAESISFRANVNTYPADAINIAALISSGSYNLDAISNFDSKGLPAFDYILFGLADSESDLIDFFATDISKEKYQQYLADIAADLLAKTNIVLTAWTDGYQNDFKNNKTNDVGSSISLFVNAYIQHYENRFRTLKIGFPAGVFSLEELSFPQLCEAYYSGNSVDLIIENFDQLEKLYYGESDNNISNVGLQEYLIGVDAADVDAEIQTKLNAIRTALNLLTNPLSEQVVSDRATVVEVYTEIQKLVPTLKADMASALSIQITYADTDGD